jgi:glutamate-ammonia-ligase adenylyltransferase
LYEIDTALRPNGNAGMLVTSFASYSAYQQQRGSNTAWTWEHQAMTRARCVLGDASLRQRFDAVRLSVITAKRDPASLRTEIMAMRARMAHAFSEKPGMFDIKQSSGGMIDAEFVMQYLVLCESAQHPELVANTGNIALLERAEVLGLLPAHIGHAAATAYRTLRQVQHTARLNEDPTQVDGKTLVAERQAILALWQAVFQFTPDIHPAPTLNQGA